MGIIITSYILLLKKKNYTLSYEMSGIVEHVA